MAQRTDPALSRAPAYAQGPGDYTRLRRQVEQQQLALTHLSEALLGLRRGTKALREENRELRRELEAARGARRVPPAAPGGQAHAARIDEILRGTSS
ncbi:MAG TPA: hypothetical protein PKB03_05360 [Baekduia sp.]|nr:hypothetical protein [Baekduia sp.]